MDIVEKHYPRLINGISALLLVIEWRHWTMCNAINNETPRSHFQAQAEDLASNPGFPFRISSRSFGEKSGFFSKAARQNQQQRP